MCGFIAGSTLACAAAALVDQRLDPLPRIPPVPLLRLPWVTVAVLGVATLAVAALGARLAQGAADKGDEAEVLRLHV